MRVWLLVLPGSGGSEVEIEDDGVVEAFVVELDRLHEEAEIQDALAEMTGQRTVPNVFIGGAHVGGCDDTMALKEGGELQRMLKDLGVSFKDDA